MPNTTCWRDGCTEPKTKWGMCPDHYQQWITEHPTITTRLHGKDEADRFWAYVDRKSTEECWIWLRALNTHGYAVFNLDESTGGGQEKGHRYAYRQIRGEIPDEIDGQPVELDHECRIRPCCNPWHLEAVTQAVNTERGVGPTAGNAGKTHCPEDHPYAGDNLIVDRNGYRSCRICTYARNNAYRSSDTGKEARREKAQPKTGIRGKGAYQKERERCPEDHPYSGDNLILEKRKRPDGSVREVRRCRTCVNEKARDNHAKRQSS
jgi:hypothetical protein